MKNNPNNHKANKSTALQGASIQKTELEWLQNLAIEAEIGTLEIDDSWIMLEQMESILRKFTQLHREAEYIDHFTYEDFADKLQLMIESLRCALGHGTILDHLGVENIDHQNMPKQLELNFMKN